MKLDLILKTNQDEINLARHPVSLFEFRLDISFKLYRKKTRSEQSAGIAMEATRFQLVIC